MTLDLHLLNGLTENFQEFLAHVAVRLNGALEGSQITEDQFHTLNLIFEKGRCTSAELAAERNVTKSSVTELVARMQAKGLVVKVDNEADRRSQYVCLTGEGESRLNEVKMKFIAALGPALAGDGDVVRELNKNLAHVNQLLKDGKK
ncbi:MULTISPECIES: MarR family winged helix-turn-helix transcriptional regulator [unclassified Corynebacterium]|uniref:MarR family winged helix-turn-helix transcriptional regulator n=1 Tax=unclassified Corynebacterium TaxID=2624378 RepID=UPI0029C9D319|nr:MULTISPECIES: MarR family transcriptional regulator [unclassified Corynebacterium]WPF66461.1 MarR family transcriptional regulator [Corynebacterium sp. 22KM0430]WPF68951.1 MarR family transcriptional regulator [Corynebacterium sp. 21KM1197]